MIAKPTDFSSLPSSDRRRVRLANLEGSAGLLAEVRMYLALDKRRDLAKKLTPILRAVRATIRRQRARGLLPDVENEQTRDRDRVFPPRR